MFKPLLLIVAVLGLTLAGSASADAQAFIPFSAAKAVDNQQQPLNGEIQVLPTDANDTPVTYTPEGGSPTTGPMIVPVVNGVTQMVGGQPFQIINSLTASPSGMLFRITVNSGNTVYLTLPKVNINLGQSYSLDSYFVPAAQTVSGLGLPHLACVPSATYTQTDAPSGAAPWLCSQLNLTDKSIQWTQNPSASASCPGGLAQVSPRAGAAYCIAPSGAYFLPQNGLQNSANVPGPLQAGPISGGSGNLPAAIVFGRDATTHLPRAATSVDDVSMYHSTVTSENLILNTTFHEGTAGATIIGTAPNVGPSGQTWQLGAGDPTASASFISGGGLLLAAQSPGPTQGPFIDLGIQDYTLHTSVTNYGGGFMMIMLRYTNANSLVFANLHTTDNQVDMYDWDGSNANQIGTGHFDYTNLTFVLSGDTISVSSPGQTPLVVTDSARHGTKIGYTLESGANAVIASLRVSTGTTTVNVPCAGALEDDGVCYTVVPNVAAMVSGNAAGKDALSMPELGTLNKGDGTATIAWTEDRTMGKFDCRDTRYGPGGCLGTNQSQALQDLSNDILCYQAQTGGRATVVFPPGDFLVGTPAQPTLRFPTGANYYGQSGIDTGISGALGLAGTTFRARYNNVQTLGFNFGSSVQTICPGTSTPVSASMSGGVYVGFGEHGCADSSSSCVNVPGDSTAHPNGGPAQDGLFIGDSQGFVDRVGASFNGANGIEIGGLDSHIHEVWGAHNMWWYLFGRLDSGQTYDPSTDGGHANAIFSGVDNVIDGPVETYGSGLNAGQHVGVEYGHVMGIIWGGGNTYLGPVFVQIEEIGVFHAFGSEKGRGFGWRIEGTYGEGYLENAGNTSVLGLQITSACRDSAVAAILAPTNNGVAHCDYLDDRTNGDTFQGHTTNDPFFGDDHSTKMVYAQGQGHFDLIGATYETFAGPQVGLSQEILFHQLASLNGGQDVTGPTPDVTLLNKIHPIDSTPVNYNTFTGAMIMQDIWIMGGNPNVTLLAPEDSGAFNTCSGHSLNLAAVGQLHFVVTSGTDFGLPPVMTEQCDPINTNNIAFNWAHQTQPAVTEQATIDVFGSIIARQTTAPALSVVPNGFSPGSFSYCYIAYAKVYGEPISSAQVCDNHTPPNNPLTTPPFINLNTTFPAGWETGEVDMISTTDPAFTPGRLALYTPAQQPGIAQSLSTLYTTDRITACCGTKTAGLNGSGGLNQHRAVPAHSTEEAPDGDFTFGTCPGSSFGVFQAHPANTWTCYPFGSSTPITSW